MIKGVGIDLLCLSRLRVLANRRRDGISRLSRRILTPSELSTFPTSNDSQLSYLGVRWSAKEAAYKALYPDYQSTWQELEVQKVNRKPEVTYKNINSSINLHLSISHDGDYITAFVVAEERN